MSEPLFTATEAAESLGIDPRSFRRWNVAPVKVEAGRRLYDGAAILANRLAAMKHRRARPETNAAALKAEIGAIQSELDRARAAGQALANAEARGELVALADLTHAIASACAAGKARLNALAGKLKRRRPELRLTDLHVVRSEVAAAMNRAAAVKVDWNQKPDQADAA